MAIRWGALLGRTKAAPELPTAGTGWRYYSSAGDGYYGNSAVSYANVDPRSNSALEAVVQWFARNFPEPPIQVAEFDREAQELVPIDGHPMEELLANPGRYSADLQQMALGMDWLIDGNAYEIKIRSVANRVVELRWAPSWTMTPKVREGSKDFISFYEYAPGGGNPIEIDPDDVIHHRYGIDPNNPRLGRSPVKTLLREIFTDDEASAYTASLLKNMGVSSMILSPATDAYSPTPDEVAATKVYVQNATTGDNRGAPLVFSGPTNVAKISFSPSEMAVREIRRIPEERISAVFGIAAVVVGLGAGLDRSTFNNFGEAREAATEQNLIPAWRLFAAAYQTQLLPEFDRSATRRVVHDLSRVRSLQEDANKAAERVGSLFTRGVLTRAQALGQIGMTPGDGDDVYLIPINLVEVPVGGAPETETPPAKGSTPQQKGVKLAPEPDKRLMQMLARARLRVEEEMAKALEESFERLGEKTANALIVVAQPKALTPEDEVAVIRVMELVDPSAFRTDIVGPIYAKFYQLTGSLTINAISSRLGVELGTDLEDQIMRQVIAEGGTRLGLVDLDAQTRSALQNAISEGRSLGEGIDAIARRVRAYVGAGPYRSAGVGYRARMIARTESKFAQNVSSIAAYRRSEVVTGLIAFDNQTGYGDPECSARDGQVFSFDEADALTRSEHPNGTLNFAPFTGAR